jgi:bifunctional non-homologous end joining protein LigD
MKEDGAGKFTFIEPMNARSVRELPEGDWLYEVKFDGYRDWPSSTAQESGSFHVTKRISSIPRLDALTLLPAKNVILDGEIVALDEKGRSSFETATTAGYRHWAAALSRL